MRNVAHICAFVIFLYAHSAFGLDPAPPPADETVTIAGLSQPVEIIKDRWGISHIYARNQEDLFFAQGYNVARDRLFQLELWRRRATGTVSELLGPRALAQDAGARLLRVRVDMKEEMNHYHPDGERIIPAFVRGINAYIDRANADENLLPIEFKMLGVKPQHWTPEVVISRHNGLFRNVGSEVRLARRVLRQGAEEVMRSSNFHPGNPQLRVAPGLDLSLLSNQILDKYNAGRSRIRFRPEDILPEYRTEEALAVLESADPSTVDANDDPAEQGSNNWVVSGSRTFSRKPMMANDPHRSQQIPSLRYWVHLIAPGWNVIGGGEPSLPGVSIGHNEYGAWGLTIFAIDQEDLLVYDTNPDDPNQYRFRDRWQDMRVIEETIAVKGQQSETVELKYTRHGPVLFEDTENHKAYALRAAWLEIGSAPYLASLRMDQAKNWTEFRDACTYSQTPSENMIWADVEGHIGWQAVGITPIRRNWYGLLPVPGDGRYEWEGFLPIKNLPNTFDPPEGFVATANEDNIPEGYPYRLGYSWSSPYRVRRIQEVLSTGRKFTLMDMMQLQHDELSLPARSLVPLLKGSTTPSNRAREALEKLLAWDFRMSADSIAATVYTQWRDRLSTNIGALSTSSGRGRGGQRTSLDNTMNLLVAPDGRFGSDPIKGRDELVIRSLEEAVDELVDRLGSEMSGWQYGQANFHHISLRHPLSRVINAELRERFDLAPLPRGGNGNTVNQTGNRFRQTSGASFRIIADTANWDNSVGTNNPGQSGDPQSPHYSDLYKLWATGKYFPIFFSREKVESVAEETTVLTPGR